MAEYLFLATTLLFTGLYWIGAEPRLNPETESTLPNVPPVEAGNPVTQS